MDKSSVAAMVAIAIIVAIGGVSAWTGCAMASQEPGGPVECAVHVAPGTLVLLGLMLFAAFGVWIGRAGVAWPPALVALGGSILFMFSLGVLVFHALATCLVVGVWHVGRLRRDHALADRSRVLRATAVAVAVFWGVCLLYFVQPFTGLFLIVAAIAAVAALATFGALVNPREPLA